MLRIFTQIVIALLLSTIMGCGGWSYIKKEKSEKINNQYEFMLPKGWMVIKSKEHVTLTRDAISLQSITVSFTAKKKAFETIKQDFPENALPYEIAELYLAEYKARNQSMTIDTSENNPKSIAGNDGFQIFLDTQNSDGVPYKLIISGFATKNGIYTLTYIAPKTRFYALDLANYTKLLNSLTKKS
ncbi:hypothetical protein [Aliikangiella maris]|uniref:Uncharacterized protein n=2 Tax=Aliikangiella maris TaxID=3162458 RepID=A0ABV2BSU2_9GAMM